MRIIFVNRYFYPDQSATSRMVSSLAFSLAREGIAVAAVSSQGFRIGDQAGLPGHERIEDVDVYRLRGSRSRQTNLLGRALDYASFHASAATWLAFNVRRGDVVVLCTDPPMISASSALPIKLRGGKIVNWVMDLFPETAVELGVLRNGSLAKAAMRLRDWSLRAGDLTLCPIDAMTDYLGGSSLGDTPTATVHHWTDEGEIHPVESTANPLRREWGLQDKFVVGYSGNFGRAHDFSTILSAAALLRAEDGIRFLMIGDGQQREAVEQEARRLQLTNMIFKPYQPPSRLAESLSAADVHLISLLPELEYCIVPSKLYGILAAGRPTIFIGDVEGEVARVLGDGACGVAVEIGRPKQLVEHISQLRADQETCRGMGRNARSLMQRNYTLGSGVDRWRNAVDALLPASPASLADGPREFAT